MKRLVLIVLGVVIVFGAIRAYRLYQDSAPTPLNAVNNYITRITIESHSPQKIEALNIVSATPFNKEHNEQLLLFQAYDYGMQIHIAGYATIKQSLFGWHVDKFQSTGKFPLPEDVMVGLDWSDNIPVIYGQVLLANVTRVEAAFNDPNQGELVISTNTSQGNFAIFGTPHSDLTTLKLLDNSGNILKQLTRDELQSG